MNNIVAYLEQLDLSEIEAKLYLQLLKMGSITVRDLARATGINRSTTYLYINQLIEKELIVKLVKGSRTQIFAIEPKKMLPYLVEKRATSTKILQEQLPDILESINVSFPKIENTGNPEIKCYKGKLGVKKIYEEALQSKELRTYFDVGVMLDTLPENEILFREALKKNKNIKIFEILENLPVLKASEEFQENIAPNEKYAYKFLPEGVKLSSTDTLIYDGNVAIVNVRNQITGIVMQNIDYYNSAKDLFDLLWKLLPEVKQ